MLARDAYTYLHLPIIAGVIMVAVGDDFLVSDPTASLSTAGLIMLVGGPALFLTAENMFRWRMIGSINSKRAVAVAALCLAGVAASALPALAVGAIVAGLLTLLALWEAAGTTNGLRADSLRRVRAVAAPVSDGGANADTRTSSDAGLDSRARRLARRKRVRRRAPTLP